MPQQLVVGEQTAAFIMEDGVGSDVVLRRQEAGEQEVLSDQDKGGGNGGAVVCDDAVAAAYGKSVKWHLPISETQRVTTTR